MRRVPKAEDDPTYLPVCTCSQYRMYVQVTHTHTKTRIMPVIRGLRGDWTFAWLSRVGVRSREEGYGYDTIQHDTTFTFIYVGTWFLYTYLPTC